MQFPKFPPHTLHTISICFYSCFPISTYLVFKLQYATKEDWSQNTHNMWLCAFLPNGHLMSKKTSQLLPNFYPKFHSKKQKVISLFNICLFMPFYAFHQHPLFKINHQSISIKPTNTKSITNTKQTRTPPLAWHQLHKCNTTSFSNAINLQ